MLWQDLLGHQQQREWFSRALASGRLGTSFLFVGPAGIGKRTFARLLAKGLLCPRSDPQSLDFCGTCEDCVQVDALTHPDLLSVAKPEDKATLPVELLIGDREHRMRAGLCHDISLRPYSGKRKVAIIDDADYFSIEGANCLLKTLEEPPLDSLLILIGTSLQRQLPTIRSRCQAVRFQTLSDDDLQTLLLRLAVVDSPQRAAEVASQADGCLSEALLLLDPELHEFRSQLWHMLTQRQLPLVELAKRCGAIIDAAGKESRMKRERQKLIFRMAAVYFRQLALLLSSQLAPPDAELQQALSHRVTRWPSGARGATRAWNRCLQAAEQVDRNANQAAVLEAWAADIARCGGC